MKSISYLAFILFLPFTLLSQSPQDPQLTPGTWGGLLTYHNQTTAFYLDLQAGDNGELVAFTYMPVIPFPKRSLGAVAQESSSFSAGSIQFSLDDQGYKLTGSFPNSSRSLHFELFPIAEIPKAKESVSSGSTASPAWTFQTAGPIWGDASADDENVYIGSRDGYLYSLIQSSGDLKWKFRVGKAIFSRPLVQGNYIYTLSDDGALYKLNIETGTPVWTFDTGGQEWLRKLPNDETPGWDTAGSGPAVHGGIVYVGSADGYLFAIDVHTGAEMWRFKTEGPIHSIPLIAEERVYFGSYDHHVYALNAATGEFSWKFDTGQMVVSSPVYVDEKVMIGSRSADLYALNATTGNENWRYFNWGSWIESSGAIYDGLLYIGSSDDQLLKSFDPKNGDLLWTTNLGGSPWTTPAVTESTVYTGTFGNANYGIAHRGGFFAVDRDTGIINWQYIWDKTADTDIYGVVSSPVVANGMLFFGGLDGVVYGFIL